MPSQVDHGELVIEELEEAARDYHPRRDWSDDELAVLRAYGGRCSNEAIADYLNKAFPPGRTPGAVEKKLRTLGA